MNNKILKDLIKELIANCNKRIKEIENNNNKQILLLKNDINNIKNLSNEEIKNILNQLKYNSYNDRMIIERRIFNIKDSLLNNISLNSSQYEYINILYDKIDQLMKRISKNKNMIIINLKDMITKYNTLLDKLSMLNKDYIDEVEVLDLVLKNSDFNYYVKKDILRNIINYNKKLYMKNS